ncbi:cadherin-like beta sandwich domain-containing protein [Cohnella rhizosphaerae]|uniref:Cadherin-like beta sandwich domain-containing protein n=1 Tax=Cohnella rhizosphaerae TaxID=1457232 RepID=A0A9X4KVQ5_9BACL|nr:cadherin-like beta sandwich domain-containing protein [Cohnella rhizosphaerae]MDG0811775.1 cadherin-like beta sandwich domain-containing protein [Cohnella rhizosphaerae]
MAAPTFEPASGAVAYGTEVTISSAGAERIYYTTDGSDPATSETRKIYSSESRPLILQAVTLKAVATLTGSHDSPVAEASYTVIPPLSQNADLSDLTLSGASLQPEFNAAITTYGANVGSGVSSVTVTPVTADSKATVTVNGNVVASGQASGSVFLNVGINPISIIVTAESGMTKQYTINVDRAPAPLTAPVFTPESGVVAYGAVLTIESPGAERIYYTTDGTDPDTQVKGSTKLYDAEAKPTINASMTVKAIAVTDGLANSAIATADYTVEESAGLSELSFSEDVDNFTFSPETYDYPDVTVQGSVDRLKVYPSGTGTITVNGQAVASGSASQNIMLASGGKTDIVIVIAETGKAPKTYAIKVDRPVYTGEMPWQLLDWTVKTDQGDWLTWSQGFETEVMFYGAIVPEEASSLSMTLNFNTDAYDEIKFYLTNDDLEGQEILFQSGIEGTLPLSNVDKTTRYEMSFYKNGYPVGQWVLLKVGKGMPDLSPIMTGLQFRDENDFFAVTPTGPNGEYGLYVSPGTTELYLVPDWENRVTIHDENDDPFESESNIPLLSDHTVLTVWVSNGMAETSYKLNVYRTGLTASLKLQDLEAEGQKLSYNPLAKSYTYTAPMDALTAGIKPLTSAGAEIERVIYNGAELTPANGLYTIAVPEEGEAIVGIVVSAGGEQYAHRLVIRRLPPIEGLNGWSLHAGINAEGPAIGVGFNDYYADGYGQVFASVNSDVQTVTAIFNLDEGASISAYDKSDEQSPDLVVDSRATLAVSEGLNSFRFELTDNEGYSHSFDLDVIRGPMPLVDLDVMDADGEYLPYEKTGPQSYHVTTNSGSVSLNPHLRGYFDEVEVWVGGEKLEETNSSIPLSPGWNEDIRIVVYEYNGGLVSEYSVAVWQGEGETPGASVDWRLRGAASLEEDPIYAGNRVAVLSPENQEAMIMPELVGDELATIERVYLNGKEIGQAEGIGTYDIDLNVAVGLHSDSTYVTLILKDADGRLIPRMLEIVSGIYAENGQTTVNEGESKGLSLVARTGSGIAATPTWEIVEEPAHGSLTHVEGPYYIYEPAPGYSGGDSFTYRASYSWNDGESDRTLFSNEATVSINVIAQQNIALSGSSLVDGYASAGSFVGQLNATGDLGGTIAYTLSEGDGDDQNSLFTIDSEGRLLVGSDLGADDPELMSIRVKASDSSGHHIEKQLVLFYAIQLEIMMNSTNGGGETGIVAGLLPDGDYWADGIMSNEQLTERENFRLAISGLDHFWTISSEGRSFEYAGGRYDLEVDKPAAGSSHDYPIAMTDEQGHSFAFTFHYYQGPIAEQLDSQNGDSGLRQSLSDGNQSYQTNIDVSEVLGWYATVSDDNEQLMLNATLESGVVLRVNDRFGREIGTEDNLFGEGALEATIDLMAYGAQERYYVYATYGGNTIVYPLHVNYEAAPALTSLSLWYTVGSGGIPIDLTSHELSVEIPSNKLIPDTPPYLPLGIEALAEPGQIVRVYRWNGEGWTEMELAPATNHDGLTKSVYSFTYREPYQEYKISVDTPGGQTATYYLSLMQPGYGGSA